MWKENYFYVEFGASVIRIAFRGGKTVTARVWLFGARKKMSYGSHPFTPPLSRALLLSFNWTQSMVVIGLLTGHYTLRRHLYTMGLSNNPTCRKCVTEEETSVHILCECEALASLRHACLGSFFFGPGGYQGASYGGHLELC